MTGVLCIFVYETVLLNAHKIFIFTITRMRHKTPVLQVDTRKQHVTGRDIETPVLQVSARN